MRSCDSASIKENKYRLSPISVVSIMFMVPQMPCRNLSTSTVLVFFFMTSLPMRANLGEESLSSSMLRVIASFFDQRKSIPHGCNNFFNGGRWEARRVVQREGGIAKACKRKNRIESSGRNSRLVLVGI